MRRLCVADGAPLPVGHRGVRRTIALCYLAKGSFPVRTREDLMKTLLVAVLVSGSIVVNATPDEPAHSHPVPEKLGTVHFTTSCGAAVQGEFDRAMALLHSFAYD